MAASKTVEQWLADPGFLETIHTFWPKPKLDLLVDQIGIEGPLQSWIVAALKVYEEAPNG